MLALLTSGLVLGLEGVGAHLQRLCSHHPGFLLFVDTVADPRIDTAVMRKLCRILCNKTGKCQV